MKNEYNEDVVEKAGGRFKLTSLLEKRYKELVFGARPLVDVKSKDAMDVLLAEVLEGKIELVPESEALAAAAAALMSDTSAGGSDETAKAKKALGVVAAEDAEEASEAKGEEGDAEEPEEDS